jgi:hypothetical protein
MARQAPVFSGRINVWEDCGEFIAEHANWKKRYSSRAPSVISAVRSLFEEMAEDGVVLAGATDDYENDVVMSGEVTR